MWRRELLKNKIYSLILIGIGALSVHIEYSGTYIWKHGSWITSETEKLRYRKEKRYDII